MGDMGDMWREIKEQRRKKREEEEPKAMVNSKRRLEAVGCEVTIHDSWSYKVKKGAFQVHYWPLSGWYQGTVSGRGIRGLLKKVSA